MTDKETKHEAMSHAINLEAIPTSSDLPPSGRQKGKIHLPTAWRLRLQHGLSYVEIGRYFQCHKSAAERACKKLEQLRLDPNHIAAFRATKGEMLEGGQLRLLASLMDEKKLRKATTNQVAFAFSKVSEQLRLERGESTANVSILSKIVQAADEKLFDGKGGHPQDQPPTGASVGSQAGESGVG